MAYQAERVCRLDGFSRSLLSVIVRQHEASLQEFGGSLLPPIGTLPGMPSVHVADKMELGKGFLVAIGDMVFKEPDGWAARVEACLWEAGITYALLTPYERVRAIGSSFVWRPLLADRVSCNADDLQGSVAWYWVVDGIVIIR